MLKILDKSLCSIVSSRVPRHEVSHCNGFVKIKFKSKSLLYMKNNYMWKLSISLYFYGYLIILYLLFILLLVGNLFIISYTVV